MIKKILKKFIPINSFRYNTLTIFSGSTISQAIYLLTYPILTRIYLPSDFGLYAIFLTFLSILTIVATGQYEFALLLPKTKKEANSLATGSIILSIILSCSFTLILFVLSPLLQKYNIFHHQNLILIIGISILINSLYQIELYTLLRSGRFNKMAISLIINIFFTTLFQIYFSTTIIKPIGLIIGYMTGTTLVTFYLYIQNKKDLYLQNSKYTIHNIKEELKRYKKFPIYNLPANLFNSASLQIPNILLNIFGQNIIGHFSLSQRILTAPASLLSAPVSYAFKEKTSSNYRKNISCQGIFIKTLKTLLIIGIIPFFLIYIFSPQFIPLIFGPKWESTALYIRPLVLMYFFQFIINPLTYMITVTEKQHINLLARISLFLLTILSISLGIYLKSPLTSIRLYSISYSIVLIILLIISYKLSKNHK